MVNCALFNVFNNKQSLLLAPDFYSYASLLLWSGCSSMLNMTTLMLLTCLGSALCQINVMPATIMRSTPRYYSHCIFCYSWSTLKGFFSNWCLSFPCRVHQMTATHMRESRTGKRASTACRWPSLSKGWSTGTKSWQTPWLPLSPWCQSMAEQWHTWVLPMDATYR